MELALIAALSLISLAVLISVFVFLLKKTKVCRKPMAFFHLSFLSPLSCYFHASFQTPSAMSSINSDIPKTQVDTKTEEQNTTSRGTNSIERPRNNMRRRAQRRFVDEDDDSDDDGDSDNETFTKSTDFGEKRKGKKYEEKMARKREKKEIFEVCLFASPSPRTSSYLFLLIFNFSMKPQQGLFFINLFSFIFFLILFLNII